MSHPPPPPPPPAKRLPEIRIMVVALNRNFNANNTTDRMLVTTEEEGLAYLGVDWRIEPCGALSILNQDPAGEIFVDYSYAPGRWIEVFRDGVEGEEE